MKPKYIDPDGTPIFSMDDIDIYGFPEQWGYTCYDVIASKDPIMVSDYKMEHERYFYKIHRYDRLARFKSTLYQLIGFKGNVPEQIILLVQVNLKKHNNLWNDVRFILKQNKHQKYYDQIPFILFKLNFGKLFDIKNETVSLLILDFLKIQDKFDRLKTELKRRYFPNIRFIVFKMLEAQSILPNYGPIPFARTRRKNVSLNLIWATLL
jgi:hypothetical protein